MVFLAILLACCAVCCGAGLWFGYLWGFDAGLRWIARLTGSKLGGA